MITNAPLWIKRIKLVMGVMVVSTLVTAAAVVYTSGDKRCGEEIIQDWYHSRTVDDKDAWKLSVALTNDPTLINDTARLKAFLNYERL